MTTLPKLTYLTVTNRDEFVPWLAFDFNRQTYKNKELLVVDGSLDGLPSLARTTARVVHLPGANVPTLRNLALQEADGEFVTWMDDDNWHSPESGKTLIKMAMAWDDGPRLAGNRVSWFLDLKNERVKRFVKRAGVLFEGSVYPLDVAQATPFNESLERGSDVVWLEEVLSWGKGFVHTWQLPMFMLCHEQNLGNKAIAHTFNDSMDSMKQGIGKKPWGKTDKALQELRVRLWGK